MKSQIRRHARRIRAPAAGCSFEVAEQLNVVKPSGARVANSPAPPYELTEQRPTPVRPQRLDESPNRTLIAVNST